MIVIPIWAFAILTSISCGVLGGLIAIFIVRMFEKVFNRRNKKNEDYL